MKRLRDNIPEHSIRRDTATMVLSGDVRMLDYARGLVHFTNLLDAIAIEHGVKDAVEWMPDSMSAQWDRTTERASRTVTTARADWQTPDELAAAEALVVEYEEVAQELRTGLGLGRFAPRVEREARELRGIINGHVKAILLQTPATETEITLPSDPLILTGATRDPYALGGVRGRVESMSRRRQLQFTLYDSVYDLAVMCYPDQKMETKMKDIWGKTILVEGLVRRDADGKPEIVRQITDIQVLEENPGPWNFERARGASAWKDGDPTPEQRIRRMRNG